MSLQVQSLIEIDTRVSDFKIYVLCYLVEYNKVKYWCWNPKDNDNFFQFIPKKYSKIKLKGCRDFLSIHDEVHLYEYEEGDIESIYSL